LSSSGLVDEALRIANKSKEETITLRVMGATAVRIHCPKFASLHQDLRREISDIDFMAYGSQTDKVIEFLLRIGYTFDRRRLMIMRYFNRYIFDDAEKRHLDVFFDKLEMCHTIDFNHRLEVDYPTISLADIVLEKLQIVNINEKDIKDCMVLLREHKVGEGEEETVNIKYISRLLAKDWGFYYTVTQNLEKVGAASKGYPALQDADIHDISLKIATIKDEIEHAPKSVGWKMRARVGNKQKWYREVEEVERT
jgi:hypothetical protein